MRIIVILSALLGLAMSGGVACAMHIAPIKAAEASAAVSVRYHRHHRGGGLFRHWCAYNCYAVPRCCGPSFYGRYGYSHYAYDEDIPFRHGFDRDASPVDNAGAYVYRFTGAPLMRAFERLY